MPLHGLKVSGLALTNPETNQFRGMPLESLDISGTKINNLGFLKTLPNLKKLTLNKGLLRPAQRRQLKQVKCQIIER